MSPNNCFINCLASRTGWLFRALAAAPGAGIHEANLRRCRHRPVRPAGSGRISKPEVCAELQKVKKPQQITATSQLKAPINPWPVLVQVQKSQPRSISVIPNFHGSLILHLPALNQSAQKSANMETWSANLRTSTYRRVKTRGLCGWFHSPPVC